MAVETLLGLRPGMVMTLLICIDVNKIGSNIMNSILRDSDGDRGLAYIVSMIELDNLAKYIYYKSFTFIFF